MPSFFGKKDTPNGYGRKEKAKMDLTNYMNKFNIRNFGLLLYP